MALNHFLHPNGQRDGHDRRKGFRHNGHGQGNAKDQHVNERLAAQQSEHDDDSDHNEGGARQRRTYSIQILLEGRLPGFDGLQELGDLSELTLHAGCNDQCLAPAIGGSGTGVDHIPAVTDRQVLRFERVGMFFDWHGLAGQRGFLHLQVDRFDNASIGRYSIAGVQDDHIAWNHLAGRDLDFLPVSDDRGCGRSHLPQRLDGPLGAILLNKPEKDREQDDHRNDD